MRAGTILETDLYVPVKEWLIQAGWTVKAEVNGCDVAAMAGDQLILVELKASMSLQLVLQGVDRQRMGDLVYVAVPARHQAMKAKRWKQILHLLKRLELGLLLVHFPKQGEVRVEEALPPVPFDRAASRVQAKRKRAALMKEFHARTGDHNTGGSVKCPLVTAYREMALEIAQLLHLHGPQSPKSLRAMGTDPGKTTGILSDNHYGWFIRVTRGVYGLTETGAQSLKLYGSVWKQDGK